MKVVGEKGLGNVLRIILEVCYYAGLIIIFALPITYFFDIDLGPVIWVIIINGTVMLGILKEFIKMFETLKNNNPFCKENVKYLRKARTLSLIEAIFWFLELLYEAFLAKSDMVLDYFIFVFLVILFVGVSIALYILSELFKQAIEYKNENELTI